MGTDHYFSEDPQAESRPREIQATLRGAAWRFITDRGVFSPTHVDPGSKLLLEAMVIAPGQRVLDVGAGYGPVGLVAARLCAPGGVATLFEVNTRAADLCRKNAALNGLDNVIVVQGRAISAADLPPQDVVVSNPPMRAGWKVVDPLLEGAVSVLKPGGTMWLVGNKHLGVKSLQKRLEALLGPSEIAKRGGGYRVLVATREVADG